jgi:hypothetical protein
MLSTCWHLCRSRAFGEWRRNTGIVVNGH